MEITFSPTEFLNKSKRILFTPKAFYKEVEKEKGWKEAFTYSIAISVIAALFGVIGVTFFSLENKPTLLEIVPVFFVSAVLVVLLGFVWSFALHLWLRVCRIKGDYWGAFKTYTYSRAPLSLFGWIPYVGALFSLYSIYLLVIGISTHYKMSKKKSFVLIIIPLTFLFVLQVVLYSVISAVSQANP